MKSLSLFSLLGCLLLAGSCAPFTSADTRHQPSLEASPAPKRSWMSPVTSLFKRDQNEAVAVEGDLVAAENGEADSGGFSLKMPKISMPKWPFGKNKRVLAVPGQDGAVGTPDKEGVYAVVQDANAAFYELGPSQAGGPDERLDAGSVITLKSFDRSWAHVRLPDGRIGWVGLDQIRYAARSEVPRTAPDPSESFDDALARVDEGVLGSDYVPPSLPEGGEDASDPNAFLDATTPEGVGSSQPETVPVDSPDILFDPLLDPLSPLPADPAFLPDEVPEEPEVE